MASEKKTVDEQILESLASFNDRLAEMKLLQNDIKLIKETDAQRTAQLSEFQKTLLEYQKHQVQQAGGVGRRSHDGISEACARYLGGTYLIAALRQNGEGMKSHVRDLYAGEIKSIFGVEAKTAIADTDILLPTGYSGDIVELVYMYGDARRLCTVFPLGAGTFKLPKLKTDPVFTLNAISAAISEKTPQDDWVTFTAEKFGGLIRLPTEIEEDSIVGMGQFIARYVARNMALCEDWQAFRSTGAGSAQNGTAEGLTTSVATDSMIVYNGGAANSTKTKASQAVLGDFRTLRTKASGAVLGQASYVVHPTYEALFSTFNNQADGVVYQRNAPGGPTLDGYRINWVSAMPAYSTAAATGVVHALFGDYRYQYFGVRGGPRIDTSREAGFATDEVLTRALQRMTVGKMATAAIAGLANSTS